LGADGFEREPQSLFEFNGIDGDHIANEL